MAEGTLKTVENEAIYVIREAFSRLSRLAMLWSIGKDSTVLLWLVRKAFFGYVPFPLVHIDTSYKIPAMIEYRDRLVRDWHLQLIVSRNEAALESGSTFPNGRASRLACCTALKTAALQSVVGRHQFNGLIVGVRRDEEPTRAKERYFSPRSEAMEWDVGDQPPEFWSQFKTEFAPGTHVRVHPLLRWTELNVWEYIEQQRIPVIPLYFEDGSGQRYRSLGCAPCTAKISSTACTVSDIIKELRNTTAPERATRAQDQESEAAFELLRRDGYM